VRSLGLKSSFHSRLARSTKLSKINYELRLSGSFSIFNAPIFRSDCPRNLLSPVASATRDEPFNYSAIRCCSSTHIPHFVDAFDSASPSPPRSFLLNSAGCIRNRVAHPDSRGTARIVWHSRPRLCINTHSSQPLGTLSTAHTASGLNADCRVLIASAQHRALNRSPDHQITAITRLRAARRSLLFWKRQNSIKQRSLIKVFQPFRNSRFPNTAPQAVSWGYW